MEHCQSVTNVVRVKVEERGKKAVFRNDAKVAMTKTRFDGCVVENETGADWIVSVDDIGDVIVELKGSDIDHGAYQIFQTAEYLTINSHRKGSLAGLLVCSRYPREDTKFQRLQFKFAKKYKGPLRAFCRVIEIEFNKALAFS